MIVIMMSLLHAFAQVPPESEALEAKKAELIELRNNFVRDNQAVINGPDPNELLRVIDEAKNQAAGLKAVREGMENSNQDNLTKLQEELRRVENREPQSDPALEQIDEGYETALRRLIAEGEIQDAQNAEALDARLAMLEQNVTKAEQALATYSDVVARVKQIDNELETLGVHLDPIVPETGWSRRVTPTARPQRPGGDR